MAKLFESFLVITRMSIGVSVLAMGLALPMLSSSAVAQNDIRTSSEDGGDTFVKRTYDDKTGKLLEVVRETEARDPNNRTKILRKVATKKYDQGKRPHYETSVDEQEIVVDGRKSIVRKHTITSTSYTKNKQRELVRDVKEEKELAGLDANGMPIYLGTRVTIKGKGVTPEKNEVWDVRTQKWVRAGSTLKQFLDAQREQVLEAKRRKSFSRPKTTSQKLAEDQDSVSSGAANSPGTHFTVDDELSRTKIIKNESEEPQGTKTTKIRERNRAGESEQGKPRIVEADKGGLLVGKSVKLADLQGCGAEFFGIHFDRMMGFESTPCPGLSGGRVATQADYLKYCNSFKDFDGPCGPPGPGTEKIAHFSGVYGMPLSVFCLGLHYRTLSNVAAYNRKALHGNFVAVFKYDRAGRKLECFYISKVQAKSVYQEYKGIKEKPAPVPSVAKSKPKEDCRPSGGLVGAINCVTKRIGGASGSTERTPASTRSTNTSTGTTTTSVRNPDGTRTVTKTDKDGTVLSTETVGKLPASASSTDPKTGVTTRSVRNSDGTRTVTKTDRGGNILSRETVGKSQASASATALDTGVTTTSVAEPEGSRTVTRTDAQGNVLSREKVR